MPDPQEDEDGDVMAGDRRLSRPDSALPDWHIPDGTYRPVPIVWFTGAFFVQLIAWTVVAVTFSTKHGLYTIIALAAITVGIGVWTWARGMKDAGLGWKIGTVVMFLFNILLCGLSVIYRL